MLLPKLELFSLDSVYSGSTAKPVTHGASLGDNWQELLLYRPIARVSIHGWGVAPFLTCPSRYSHTHAPSILGALFPRVVAFAAASVGVVLSTSPSSITPSNPE